jgi:hypothetical protein
VKDQPQTLGEYFGDFIERRRIRDGETFQLLVTDEDCMRLGEFFIRGMVGWASGCIHDRELPAHLADSTEMAAKEIQ